MRRRGAALAAAVVTLGLAACSGAGGTAPTRAPERTVRISVRSEEGDRVARAQLLLVGREAVSIEGPTSIEVDQPVAGVLRADGYLDEPVVLDPGDAAVTVQLLHRLGPTGTARRVLHFGGDVMLGRRYQTPGGREGTPTVADADDARAVVQDIAPLMAAADSTMVNLETVVGDLAPEDAYAGKRYQLQSPPTVVDALQEMGVDVAALGNNHAYDWQEAGVRSTIDALDDGGIAWTGAGETAAEAAAGRMVDVRGTKVGVVSATTVDGDFVNDSLPGPDDVPPVDLDPADAWQYEARELGFGEPGDANHVPFAARRPGAAWQEFSRLEPDLDAAQAGALWAALTADGAYPELQDWVARRGHGGAAAFDSPVAAAQVAALRSAGAGLVVVQIHGGFQFAETPSDFMRRSARAAVDAGADLVVAHHPHVLQGFEWYEGKLIAYSLGNLVFDQDFLSTFPSVILRTVFEGDRLVEARIIPLTIDRYRPVAVSGPAADRVLRLLNARSAIPASSERLEADVVASVLDAGAVTNAAVERDGTTGRVAQVGGDAPVDRINVGESGQLTLPACTIVSRPTGGAPDPEAAVGTDLLTWGSLEDATADGSSAPATHWQWSGPVGERYDEDRGAYLHLAPGEGVTATARQVARSAVPAHRFYGRDGRPVDGPASYTAELDVRAGRGSADLVAVLYDVNDTDPTVDPESVELHRERVPLPDSALDAWATVSVDLTEVIDRTYGGVRPEALLLYVVAPSGSEIDVDGLRLLEWRSLADLPVGAWVVADALRSAPETEVVLGRTGCT